KQRPSSLERRAGALPSLGDLRGNLAVRENPAIGLEFLTALIRQLHCPKRASMGADVPTVPQRHLASISRRRPSTGFPRHMLVCTREQTPRRLYIMIANAEPCGLGPASIGESIMQRRRRFKQIHSLEARLD